MAQQIESTIYYILYTTYEFIFNIKLKYAMELILLCLLIVIYFDMALLKRQDQKLFGKVFVFPPFKALASFLCILFIFFISDHKGADISPLILLFVLPVYLLRRDRFTRVIKQHEQKSIRLLSSAVGVVVIWMYGALVFGFLLSVLTDLFAGRISEMGNLILFATSCGVFGEVELVYRVLYVITVQNTSF